MDAHEIYLLAANAAVCLIFLVSLAGCVIPALPGPILAAAAVLAHKMAFPEFLQSGAVYACVAAAAAAQVLDFLMSWLGAKRFGASWKGGLGAALGAVVAIFVPPQIITIFVFPFAGALIAELAAGAGLKNSVRAGFGAFVGGVAATCAKLACCALIFAVFAASAFKYYAGNF